MRAMLVNLPAVYSRLATELRRFRGRAADGQRLDASESREEYPSL